MNTFATITVRTTPENPWMLGIGIAILAVAYALTRIYDRRLGTESDEPCCGYCRGELEERPVLLGDLKTSVARHVCVDCGAESFPGSGSTATLQQDALKTGQQTRRVSSPPEETSAHGGGIFDLERHPHV